MFQKQHRGLSRARARRLQHVRGAARDVNSVANCTENAMNGSDAERSLDKQPL